MKKNKQSMIAIGTLIACAAITSVLAVPAARVQTIEAVRSAFVAAFPINAEPQFSQASPTSASSLTSFRFLPPLGQRPVLIGGIDTTLLNFLEVEVCEMNSGTCSIIRTFTAQGSNNDRIQLSGNHYHVNWNTQGANPDLTRTIRVVLAGLELGSITVSPGEYATLGTTWPIKFQVEPDPVIRVRLLRSQGKNAWQIASALNKEFDLCGQETAALMAGDLEPYPPDQVQQAIAGVCQDVIIPDTTKIADGETIAAHTSYDPVAGRMVFASNTNLLRDLRAGDVFVSEPTPAAPYGFLRKITSTQRHNAQVILETVQAKLTEAISEGTLDISGDLLPADDPQFGALALQKGSSEKGFSTEGIVIDEGEAFNFERNIDVTINFDGSEDGIDGTGSLRVTGSVLFDARYNVGMGIRPCFGIPPACVDRFEAWAGAKQRSKLRVEGTFDGTIHKERVIHPIPLQPIWVFIGPLPVILVPEVNVLLGVDGKAHVDFVFDGNANSTFKVGAKWLNPDYGGNGWNDISEFDLFSGRVNQANLNADMRLEAYAKLDAKIKLYGIVGPGMEGSVGIEGDVQTGRSPFWRLRGHVTSAAKFEIGLAEIIDVGVYREPILNEYFHIAESVNQPPVFSNVRSGAIQGRVGTPVFIGPDAGFAGGKNYDVTDPEGDIPLLSASSPGGTVTTNPLRITFGTPGFKTVTITARDSAGLTATLFLGVDIRNSPPSVTVTPAAAAVPAKTQLWLSATAYDPEDGTLRCSRLNWIASGSHSLNVSSNDRSCSAVVKFNDPGPHTVTVNATDSGGLTISKVVNVTVGPQPAILLPEIEIDSFSIKAISRYRVPGEDETSLGCFPSVLCEVPDESLLDNGQAGDYIPPLIMRLNVSHPNGDPVAVQWHCQTGSSFAPVTYNGDGSWSCNPFYSPTEAIKVYAVVGPPPPPLGDTNQVIGVTSEVRTFYMLQLVN